ncbi:625_t:CDS:2 [Funneliformis mosseae]|uniref:625_t:CDS:1 n=1 Tax=Funneliformis mosseae TaxID=27381 RepID=A0A9N8ZRL1_FUNMO|nr:625_t:CDS:2 [Funneliformis mosseae]
MVITTQIKYKRILEEVKVVKKANLIQKELTENESNSDYEAETSQLIFIEESENDSNSEAKDKDPDFINMINEFDKYYKIPYIKSLKIESQKHVKLEKIHLKINFTYTAYFFDIRHLEFTAELPYLHSSTEIKEHLLDLFNEWKIKSKISAIVTDNDSNVKNIYNELGIGEKILCTTHTLQLSIGKELDKIEPLADKCKQLKELEKEVESRIYFDVVKANNTRWNSILYAFQRLIILKPAILMLKVSLMSNTSSYIHKESEKLEELYPTVNE